MSDAPNYTNQIWKNRNKSGDKHPDYRGEVEMPDGSRMEIALWERTTKNGNAYFYAKASVPRERGQEQPAPPPQPERNPIPKWEREMGVGSLDDEIPF